MNLSEDAIVAAALKLTRAVGVDGLTMRRLAEELHVTPMAVYYHVQDKGELLRLVVGSVLSKIDLPSQNTGTWEEQLYRLYQELRRELSAYPGLAHKVVDMRITPPGRRLAEAFMQLLRDAGFDETETVYAYGILQTYMFGRLEVESRLQARNQNERGPAPHPEHHGGLRGDASFDFAVQTLIAGLRSQLHRRP